MRRARPERRRDGPGGEAAAPAPAETEGGGPRKGPAAMGRRGGASRKQGGARGVGSGGFCAASRPQALLCGWAQREEGAPGVLESGEPFRAQDTNITVFGETSSPEQRDWSGGEKPAGSPEDGEQSSATTNKGRRGEEVNEPGMTRGDVERALGRRRHADTARRCCRGERRVFDGERAEPPRMIEKNEEEDEAVMMGCCTMILRFISGYFVEELAAPAANSY